MTVSVERLGLDVRVPRPVVNVVLMTAVTVVVTATVGAFVFGLVALR